MSVRQLKQIAALLASFWAALLMLMLLAPVGCALAEETVPRAASAAAASAEAASAEAASAAESEDASPAAASAASAASEDWSDESPRHRHHRAHAGHSDDEGDDVVSIGHDAELGSDRKADSVVSVGGDARSAGAADEVVSVLGSTRVTGPLSGDAVAVLGDVYVDAAVQGDVVGVLGDVELGPHAEVGGDVVSVMGTLKRDPAAIVHGHVESVGGGEVSFAWLRPWMKHCALLGRPLALDSGVSWAWVLALAFLALYALVSLAFPRAVSECGGTLEAEPGRTVLAAFLMVLLVPLALLLLAITGIGLLAWPFALAGLFCAGVFGKAALLAWMGKHLMGARAAGALAHPAAATVLGGILVLVAYLIPVVGFITWNLLGLMSLGLVAITLLRRTRGRAAPVSPPPRLDTPHGDAAHTAAAPRDTASAAAAGGTADATPRYTTMSGTTESSMNTTIDPLGAAGAPHAASAAGASGTPYASTAGHRSRQVDPALAATLPRAGFWIRMAALLVDGLLIGLLAHLLGHESQLHLVLLAIYGALMWKLRGATVGDIVFDLQVARVDGRPIDWETSIVRALGCFLSLFVAFLGFFWIAFDDAKQAWHDKIAGTVVVRVPKAVPAGT